jgi:choice-of-anchor B domain-containing protein
MRLSSLALPLALLIGIASCGDNKPPLRTIADHVEADPTFSSLEAALEDAELLATLDGPGPFTLFAFRNSSFDPSELEPSAASALLSYHIHQGNLDAAALEKRTAISTLHGSELHVRYGLDGILLNDGVLVKSESIPTENGIIHVIDRALSRTLFTETREFYGTADVPLSGFTSDFITIEDGGYIHDLQISLDITDKDVSNLFVYLAHAQSGAFVTLMNSPNSNLDDPAFRFADSAELDVVADVVSDGEPGDKAFPRATYRPVDPLEYLVGHQLAGEWELTIWNFGEEEGEIKGEVTSFLRNWSMIAVVGEEPPAPAIVFNPRRGGPAALGRNFTESAVAQLRRVGGLEGEITLQGNAGEIQARTTTLREDASIGALLFDIPAQAELGTRKVTISAQSGSTSRIISFESTVSQPQSSGLDFVSHVPVPTLGSTAGRGNDIWGWTDPSDGKEIAIIGTSEGTAFVDLSEPASPKVLGILPTATGPSTWRDVKVYKDHAFIVSEARDHGMQIFDLKLLRGITQTQELEPSAYVDIFGNAHNIAINEDTGTAFVVGSDYDGCDGGMLVFDITTPLAPTAISCFSGAKTNGQVLGPSYPTDVYTHDVQCVTYAGPDADYTGREICFSSDEQTVGVADFTDHGSPSQIVRLTYESAGYTHQGWLTDDHKYFVMNDEYDEVDLEINTTSYVWDMSDLDSPVLIGTIDNPSNAVGHNTYIADNIAYQANYTSGLRLVDLSAIGAGMSPEVGFYDTYPDDDATCRAADDCGIASFDGAWSSYPFFESGLIVVSDIQRGLFVLKRSN